MEAYGLYDLYLSEIPYNNEYFDAVPSANLVKKQIDIHLGKSSEIDNDHVKALAFYIEEQNGNAQSESIHSQFRELVRKVRKMLLEAEKNSLSDRYDPNSAEYLEAYSRLLSEGKKLGII